MRSFIQTGEVAGSTSAAQLPSIAGKLCRIQASHTNVGYVYLGTTSGVTKEDGTTDITTGFMLAPGQDTGWMPIPQLDWLWRICDNAGDDLTYMMLN